MATARLCRPAFRATAPVRRTVRRVTLPTAKAISGTKVGYRWDAANMRWVRDDRKIANNEATGGVMKPLSGGEYTVWPVVWTELQERGLKSVTTEEAAELVKKGWVLVDVRLEDQFERQRAEGSISLPLYRYVQGQSQWDNIKRLAMASFAMSATERNDSFRQEALETLGKNRKVIVLCDIGGTLETVVRFGKKSCNDKERAFGRESRSLKAAYELLQAGWSINNIVHLKGGLPQWRYDGYPIE